MLDSSNQPAAYGVPVVIDSTSGKLRAVKSGDSNVTFGILVRPYPHQSSDEDFGSGTPPTSGIVDVLRRGYIQVAVKGTPKNGGAVYVRVANEEGNDDPIGGIEAASDSTNTVAITGASFTGVADNGTAEISFNL
jgi:hypothetical protein